jgi:hypothetical protein
MFRKDEEALCRYEEETPKLARESIIYSFPGRLLIPSTPHISHHITSYTNAYIQSNQIIETLVVVRLYLPFYPPWATYYLAHTFYLSNRSIYTHPTRLLIHTHMYICKPPGQTSLHREQRRVQREERLTMQTTTFQEQTGTVRISKNAHIAKTKHKTRECARKARGLPEVGSAAALFKVFVVAGVEFFCVDAPWCGRLCAHR